MTRTEWAHEYKRLCTAFSKKAHTDESAEYFTALQSFHGACVHDAVSRAIREAKYYPKAAELTEFARAARHAYSGPTAVCETCHGSTWTQHPCDGVVAHKDGPVPTDHGRFCGVGDVPHQHHAYARRCHVCWVRVEGAA